MPEKKKRAVKKRRSKKDIVVTKGKKKRSVARTRIKNGSGSIRINGALLELHTPEMARNVIEQPLTIARGVLGNDFEKELDVDINVKGGGVMSQAEACKTSLGKALLEWTENEDLKEEFLTYDRSLLVDDVRRKEPKKPMRKGARARYQKSYR
jgi:small subunit ribosomal protein S9